MKTLLTFILCLLSWSLGAQLSMPMAVVHYQPTYTLHDMFLQDVATNAVNGTAALPGPGTRVVVDTVATKLSVAGGKLTCSGGKAVPAYGDPGYWLGATTRAAGIMYLGEFTVTDATSSLELGWDTGQTGALDGNAYRSTADTLKSYSGGTAGPTLYVPLDGTAYPFAVILRSTGAYDLVKESGLWKLLWQSPSDATATVYPGIAEYDAVWTADNLRIPTRTWLPTPIAYDSFYRADGAIGVTDTSGPDAQVTPSLTWASGGSTWTISSSNAVNTPTETEQIVNGDFASDVSSWTNTDWNTFEWSAGQLHLVQSSGSYHSCYQGNPFVIGNWYHGSVNITRVSGTGKIIYQEGANTTINSGSSGLLTVRFHSTVGGVLRFRDNGTTADEFLLDNASAKLLTLNTLFCTVPTSTSNVVASVATTITAGTQAGLVLSLDSTSSPANCIIVYHDGVNIHCDQLLAGTWSSLLNTAATYAAGANIVAITDNGTLSCYYNNVKFATTAPNAAVLTYKNHGMFSTYSGNSLNNFTLFARGNEGQFNELNVYAEVQ